ncbi:hypothetical protein ACHAXT_010954 [Thalassiosira profunda]
MDFGNTCALICRFVLLILLLYGIVLSSMVVSSCHMISAVTHDDESHGVGLQTFEDESGTCVPHNAFVVDNYNGMEMAAKVGGYVAPTLASLVVLWCLLECCYKDGCWGGKCVPMLLLVGAAACQGITFLLFQSDLFCSNKDIASCQMGDAGWRSMQACFVYAVCLILYKIGPTPVPFAPPSNMNIKTRPEPQSSASSSKKSKGSKKSKKTQPGKGEEWTKEMYEQRRKDNKAKSRGTSGRSKKEILGGRDGREDSYENSLALYEPGRHERRGERSQPKFDDYVDTDPDGMDWSAYTPNEREAYYDRQRSKKQALKERELQRDYDERGYSDERDYRDSRSSRGYADSYMEGGRYGDEESYRGGESYYSDRGGDSYYSDRDRRGYEMKPYDDGRGGRMEDSFGGEYSAPGDRYDSRGGVSRGGGDGRADYSYAEDSYAQDSYTQDSYAQQDYGNDPPSQSDIYYGESSRGDTRRSGSRGSSGRGGRSYADDSYADNERSRYRDDPSAASFA